MAQTTIRRPLDAVRRAFAVAAGKIRRRRYPSRAKLIAMSPTELEAFLEGIGAAQRTRDAIAASDARRARQGSDH